MTTAVHFGTFGAEGHWRPPDLAELPRLASSGADPVIGSMDEMLFGFTGPGDLLITRRALTAPHREAMAKAGFDFEHRCAQPPVADGGTAVAEEPAVEELLARDQELVGAMAGHERVRPFAVLPATRRLLTGAGRPSAVPPAETVARVNGKAWSTALAQRLGLPGAGRTVRSAQELEAALTRTLAGGERVALVKDAYGVAGQGTVEVMTPRAGARLVRHVRRQEERGLRVTFVVQPRHARRADFSGHLEIGCDGTWEHFGLRSMTNDGYRHHASGPPTPEVTRRARRGDYTAVLDEVARALVAEGYSGPVGVDSMLVEGDTWVPLLEVNARSSLGLLSLHLDRRAARHGLNGHLWQSDVAVEPGAGIDGLLRALSEDGLLYTRGPRPGVLPLVGGSLRTSSGRLFCAAFCAPEEFPRLRERTRASAGRAGIHVKRGGVPV
ncbi:hypothetical protein OHA98_16605 [Streptomyces sp. NBC_00654]|uniref:hypothetical protein n=1 Tax=Streptomyces sp. NBC_00654 TaxID=2975799 RepID=UPI00224FA116|nr:hypothetical protein [Streptomyces sp. NBC_00654]MCX4966426.1 hypothetical protein [Streptomyces sp. NBC_00654]